MSASAIIRRSTCKGTLLPSSHRSLDTSHFLLGTMLVSRLLHFVTLLKSCGYISWRD